MSFLENPPIRLEPGQSRPLAFRIRTNGPVPISISLNIQYVVEGSLERPLDSSFSHTFSIKDIHGPHKFTFLHPSSIVSYAIIRAPSRKVCSQVGSERGLPVLLTLHGAGVDADAPEVCHMLDPVPDLPSWVIFPTGTTPWCGDDWRAVSFSIRAR